MSYHARDGKNANAAVVVSVGAEDFAGDPRRAIAFQRELEAKAYAAGRRGGAYAAPAENVQSFLVGKGQLNIGRVEPTYDRGVVAADLGALVAGEVAEERRLQNGTGNATFRNDLIDAVFNLTETQLTQGVRYEIYQG